MQRIVKIISFLALIAAVFILPACPPYEGDPSHEHPPASLREIDADNPVIVIGGKNRYGGEDIFVAGWEQANTVSSNINAFTSHYHFGWGWYFGHAVDDEGEGQTTLLRLAASDDGSEFAVWYKITPLENRIYANRLPNHNNYTEWETAQSLTGPATILDIAITADAYGNAIIIWVQADTLYNRLYARRYTPDNGWDAAQTIDDNTGNCSLPQIASDEAGNAIAIWQHETVSSTSIYANDFSVSVGWGTGQLISSNTSDAYSPDIAMNSSGSGMAVWQEDEGGTHNAYSRYFDSGLGWGTSQLIEAGATSVNFIRVAMDDTGSAVAAWQQPDIYFNRYDPGSGWGAEQLIAPGYVGNPNIAANAEGKTIITWNQWDVSSPYPGDALIYARKFDPATGWEDPIKLSSEPGSANAPDAAIDLQGHATVIWSQSVDSGTSAVFSYSY